VVHGGDEVLLLRLLQCLHLLLDVTRRGRIAVVAIDHCQLKYGFKQAPKYYIFFFQ